MSDAVYGIDLGTTYSAIARINENDRAEVVRNFDGDDTTPSVVYFEGGQNVVVGAEAKRIQLAEPADYPQEFQGQVWTPESISALILKELVRTANSETGDEVRQVVITVPAYFGIQEKEATKQAGTIAGLEVVGIVTEPVAAALSLGIRGDREETIFVYDLGGGTFDTTIMKVGPGRVEVVAIDGNRVLGGADWDNALAEFVIDRFIDASGLSSDDDPRFDEDFMIELLSQAEGVKKSLTRRDSATVRCRYKDKDEQVVVTRAEFQLATSHLVAQTIEICKRVSATAEAKQPGLRVDKVLLVGGSSRMPMIDAALRNDLGWDPVPTDFDLAVAKGAAVYGQAAIDEALITDGSDQAESAAAGGEAKYFLGGESTLSVTNVLSRGLGIGFVRDVNGSWEDYVSFLVHANDALPATPPAIPASTIRDNQEVVEIALYEQGGERESDVPADNNELKKQELRIPAMPKGSGIQIELTVTSEGLATVRATEPISGAVLEMEVQVAPMDAEQVAEATELVSGMLSRS